MTRARGEAYAWAAAGVAGAMCVVAAVLPWVQVPVGFEGLRVNGVEWPEGIVVLGAGLVLAGGAAGAAKRPDRRFGVARHAAVALALAALTVAGWVHVDRVLETERADIGVHPGTHGAGVRLAGVAALVLAGAALYIWRVRLSDARRREPAPPSPR